MSTRRAITLAIAVLVLVAVTASAALVVLTTVLDRIVKQVGHASDRVVLAEHARMQVLELERLLREGAAPEDLEAAARRLEDRVASAEDSAATPGGAARARAVAQHVGRVLGALRASPRLVTADDLAALRASIDEYLHHYAATIGEEQDRAERWDSVANAWGLASAALLLLGLATVLVAVRTHLLAPLLGIADGIRRYAGGNGAVHVEERGPAELREVAAAVNDMIARLERRRDEQLAFLAGVAHDLRNPLSALRLATRALGGRVASDFSRGRAVLDLVDRQVERLDRMAGDFLDAARIEAGQIDLAMEHLDLRDVARHAVELYTPASAAHRLLLHVPDEPVLVWCDGARLDQVVNNLVSNAIKYSPRGGRIDVTVDGVGGEAVLAVADEGIGIPREDLAHLFQPFRRGTRLRDAVPGLGLGLAMARRIVERHAGRIEVASSPGHGSTFRVRLPLASRDARAVTEPVG